MRHIERGQDKNGEKKTERDRGHEKYGEKEDKAKIDRKRKIDR